MRLNRADPACSMASPAQRVRAMQLYRHALKNVISWAVRREIFYEEVSLRDYTLAGV